MQRIVRTKTFVFEAPISDEIISKLSLWGQVASRGRLTVFVMDSGEIKTRVVKEDARNKVRRIYIEPSCGCKLTLDEVRDFERDSLYYKFIKYEPCDKHK